MENKDESIQLQFERDDNGDFLTHTRVAELPSGKKVPIDVLIITGTAGTQTKNLVMPVDKKLLKTEPDYVATVENNALKFFEDVFGSSNKI